MLQPGQNGVHSRYRNGVNGEVGLFFEGDKRKDEATTPLQHDFHCQATIPDFAICSSGQLEEMNKCS